MRTGGPVPCLFRLSSILWAALFSTSFAASPARADEKSDILLRHVRAGSGFGPCRLVEYTLVAHYENARYIEQTVYFTSGDSTYTHGETTSIDGKPPSSPYWPNATQELYDPLCRQHDLIDGPHKLQTRYLYKETFRGTRYDVIQLEGQVSEGVRFKGMWYIGPKLHVDRMTGELTDWPTPNSRRIRVEGSLTVLRPPIYATRRQSDSEPTCTLAAHGGKATALAFSPDGKLLALGGEDGTVCIKATDTWVNRSLLVGNIGDIVTVAFSPDGRLLATTRGDHTLCLWDAHSGAALRRISPASGTRSIAFSPDGRLLAAPGPDHTVQLWDAATGAVIHTLSGHRGTVESLVFAPDGTILASGGGDGLIKFWDTRTWQERKTMAAGAGRVSSLAVSPDSTLVASAHDDGAVRLWQVRTGRLLRTLKDSRGLIGAVAFSPDGAALIAGDRDHEKADARDRNGIPEFGTETIDGKLNACPRGTDGGITIWSVATGQKTHTFTNHNSEDQISALAVSPDGRRALALYSGTVTVWPLPR